MPSRLSVLVIDADEVSQRIVSIAMGESVRFRFASSADEALAALEHGERFDGIVCDVDTAEIPPRPFIEDVRVRSPEQASRIIIASLLSAPDDLADRWLAKPFTIGALTMLLDHVRLKAASAQTTRFPPCRVIPAICSVGEGVSAEPARCVA